MKKLQKILGILSLLLLLGACSPFSLVNSEVYNNADLAEYKTFRIVTPDMGKLPPGMEMATYYNIAAAIREEMVMRGYTESSTSPLLINIAVTTQREIETAPLVQPGYFPYLSKKPCFCFSSIFQKASSGKRLLQLLGNDFPDISLNILDLPRRSLLRAGHRMPSHRLRRVKGGPAASG